MGTTCTKRRRLLAVGLLARLLGQGLIGLPPAAAQTATSGAEDARVLREAKAAADTSACGSGPYFRACPLGSWAADTEPCGDGYDSPDSGWLGVHPALGRQPLHERLPARLLDRGH